MAAGLVSINCVYCIQEPVITVTPYSFPAGIINVIRYSETPLAPFKNLVEEEYPLLHLNYSVQNDGWLEMTRIILNGTNPISAHLFCNFFICSKDNSTLSPGSNFSNSSIMDSFSLRFSSYELSSWLKYSDFLLKK